MTAHPDDAEGFGGGIVAALQRAGNTNVSYLITTNGDKGGECYTGEPSLTSPPTDFHLGCARHRKNSSSWFSTVYTQYLIRILGIL